MLKMERLPMDRSGREQRVESAPKDSQQKRIVALDGLRGLAALIVVMFHFLYMLVPTAIPAPSQTPFILTDTPLGILWNGRFAVSIFFVLSGFVIAAAAERRSDKLVSNIITRYCRLAIPVTTSVIFAWLLLNSFPTATDDLATVMDSPSHWLNYTHQGQIPSFYAALSDGAFANFLAGRSDFNNVLWTMKIELVGSILIFVIYSLTFGRYRLTILILTGLLIPLITRPDYLGFIMGALIYEARARVAVKNIPAWATTGLFCIGVIFGAPGEGFSQRWDLPTFSYLLTIGNSSGVVPVFAATCIIFAVVNSAKIALLFSSKFFQWLGNISFGLYLTHVPLLYTIVASAYVNLNLNFLVLTTSYILITFILAQLFTISVDKPTLRLFPIIRSYSERCDRLFNLIPLLWKNKRIFNR